MLYSTALSFWQFLEFVKHGLLETVLGEQLQKYVAYLPPQYSMPQAL